MLKICHEYVTTLWGVCLVKKSLYLTSTVKKTLKHIFALLLIGIILMTGSCKKELATSVKAPVDFRDSIVGNYFCTNHHSTSDYHGTVNSDEIWGTVTLTVTKSSAGDSSIQINGQFFSSYSIDPFNVWYFNKDLSSVFSRQDGQIRYVYMQGPYGYDGAFVNYYIGYKQ